MSAQTKATATGVAASTYKAYGRNATPGRRSNFAAVDNVLVGLSVEGFYLLTFWCLVEGTITTFTY